MCIRLGPLLRIRSSDRRETSIIRSSSRSYNQKAAVRLFLVQSVRQLKQMLRLVIRHCMVPSSGSRCLRTIRPQSERLVIGTIQMVQHLNKLLEAQLNYKIQSTKHRYELYPIRIFSRSGPLALISVDILLTLESSFW